MINFSTSYKTKYTVPEEPQQKGQFVSNYSVKKGKTVISGNSRPKNLKFKSRLVTK